MGSNCTCGTEPQKKNTKDILLHLESCDPKVSKAGTGTRIGQNWKVADDMDITELPL